VDGDVSPLLILVLVILGLAVAVFLLGLTPDPRRRRAAPGLLRRRSKWWAWLPVLPLLAAIGCLVLAFSGFRFRLQEVNPIAMLVMDVSNSMNAEDVDPTRLAAARTAGIAFVDQLPPGFEVGLATFADGAFLAVSPTADREVVIDALSGLDTTERGTHIGDGLAAALQAIQAQRAGRDVPAAMLLLSDGEDSGSTVAPEDVAADARRVGVPIFGVWIGDPEGEDTEGLEPIRRISSQSKGAAFTAGSRQQLIQRFRTLGSRFSVDLATEPSTTPLVVAAIVFVVLAGLLLVITAR
jgi:Ca-activated chloride channel family protein